MVTRLPSLLACVTPLVGLACGPPPVPLDGPGPSPMTPTGTHRPVASGPALEIRVSGTVRLVGELAAATEGRLFLFVRDAHTGAVILNRAYEVSDAPFAAGDDGDRVLDFALGPEDQLGDSSGSDGHLSLEVRLDADGEVLSADDALAVASLACDAGATGLEVVLRAADSPGH